MNGREVLHILDIKAHDAAVGFSLTEKFLAIVMHGDRKVEALTGLP